MPNRTDAPGPPAATYTSFAELRQAHTDLLRRFSRRSEGALLSGRASEVEQFLAAAAASGAVIEHESDRQNAQGILDYWAAEVLSVSDVDATTWSLPRLATFDPAALEAPSSAIPGNAANSAALDVVQTSLQIRLGATARLWRDSHDEGYLLSGSALDEAAQIANVDPDIRLLVHASRALAGRKARRERVGLLGLVVLLLSGLVLLLMFWRDAVRERAEAIKKTEEVEQALRERDQKELDLALQSASAMDARGQAEVSAVVAQSRLSKLESSQRLLEATLQTVRNNIDSGRLTRDVVPGEVWTAATAPRSPETAALPSSEVLEGYDASFIGPTIPLPRLSPTQQASAFDGGRPVDYRNYSVVLDATRRVALFSAANLDRQKLRVLRRVSEAMQPDPRVGLNQQLSPEWFERDGLVSGRLVTRQEIAWGDYFSKDDEQAAREVGVLLDVYPNVTVRRDAFPRNAWTLLERWVFTDHNKSASKVTIFSGPVLRRDDPTVDGVQVPQQYWKIAVSLPLLGGSHLVVDAFLMSETSTSAPPSPSGLLFSPKAHRATVADIEASTGLDFGEAIRSAGKPPTYTAEPKRSVVELVASQVDRLGDADEQTRKATAQNLVNVIRDESLPDDEKRVVVDALVDVLNQHVVAGSNQNGLYNTVFVLGAVPTVDWSRTTWSRTNASLRQSISILEEDAAARPELLGPKTKAQLDRLKNSMNWLLPSDYTVDLQFAGFPRAKVKAISAGLKELGWNVRGEERLGTAAGKNEVRYGDPADEKAAMQLAADLGSRTTGKPARTLRVASIRPSRLEIWISE